MEGDRGIIGVMLESFLVAGRQDFAARARRARIADRSDLLPTARGGAMLPSPLS